MPKKDVLEGVSVSELYSAISLRYHTARNMQTQQLIGTAERTARQLLLPRLPIDFNARYEERIPDKITPAVEPMDQNLTAIQNSLTSSERQRARDYAQDAVHGEITFMNRTISFGTSNELDWEHPDIDSYPLYWRLKLQSLTFLEWAVFGFDTPTDAPPSLLSQFNAWIRDWYLSHQIGERGYLRRNWIPHSVSLRALNLIRYAAWLSREDKVEHPVELLPSIYKNLLFLLNHIEYDIGGNHLIENAVALVVGGVFLQDDDLLQSGNQVLQQSTQQFLTDGGHFERSPMYHIQALTRFLTAIDLLSTAGYDVPEKIRETAKKGTEFLQILCPVDERIPLFNDSVFGYTHSLQSCLNYAENLDYSNEGLTNPNALPASGYYWVGRGESRMLVDGGNVGVPELPAHSHNDIGSYVWWVGGKRVVTDTGTYQYASDVRRKYARSVRSHNTVQVEDMEPIPIGGQYLMGARIVPSAKHFRDEGPKDLRVGYRRTASKPRYKHERRFYHDSDWWLVSDNIQADKEVTVTSRIHLHPDFAPLQRSTMPIQISDGETSCWLKPINGDVSFVKSEYYPEFGTAVDRQVIQLSSTDTDVRLDYLLSLTKGPSITIDKECSLSNAIPGIKQYFE